MRGDQGNGLEIEAKENSVENKKDEDKSPMEIVGSCLNCIPILCLERVFDSSKALLNINPYFFPVNAVNYVWIRDK